MAQRYPGLQVVVVCDDRSSDGTPGILRACCGGGRRPRPSPALVSPSSTTRRCRPAWLGNATARHLRAAAARGRMESGSATATWRSCATTFWAGASCATRGVRNLDHLAVPPRTCGLSGACRRPWVSVFGQMLPSRGRPPAWEEWIATCPGAGPGVARVSTLMRRRPKTGSAATINRTPHGKRGRRFQSWGPAA